MFWPHGCSRDRCGDRGKMHVGIFLLEHFFGCSKNEKAKIRGLLLLGYILCGMCVLGLSFRSPNDIFDYGIVKKYPFHCVILWSSPQIMYDN